MPSERVNMSFMLSMPMESVRIPAQLRRGMKPHFLRDIDSLHKASYSGSGINQIGANVVGITDAYIYPPKTFTMALLTKDGIILSGTSGVQQLSPQELDPANPKSLFNHVLRGRRSLYFPRIKQTEIDGYYLMQYVYSAMNAIYVSGHHQLVPNAVNASVDVNSVCGEISKHSGSMVMLPMRYKDMYMGMMIFTFEDFKDRMIFGDNETPAAVYSWEHLNWLRLLADSATLALSKMSA